MCKPETTLERYFENHPNFRESITYFYHGYIEGLIDSQFFDSTILHSIEIGLGILYHLGYQPLGKKEDIHFYDLTNSFILELCQKIAVISPKDLGQPTSLYTTVFKRFLDFVIQQIVNFKTDNPLVIQVKLFHLGELFRLPIPFNLRTPILKYLIIVLNHLIKVEYKPSIYHVFFFAILQKIWVQMFDPSFEINPRIYQEFLSELIKLYEVQLSLGVKTKQRSHPFINQMNRTFIDLIYYLIEIFKELKLKDNLNKIYNLLNNNLLKIGDNLFSTYPDNEFYKWILEPLAIIRYLMVSSNLQEPSKILSKKSIFDSLCSIGTSILLDLKSQKDKKSEKIFQYQSKTQEIITKVFPFDELFDCIEYRQGNWEVFGYYIGSEILKFIIS